jgi:hypothetical protein
VGISGVASFSSIQQRLNCGSVLEDINFAGNVPGLTIMGFDPATGAIDPTTGAVPEPATWALITTGFLSLGGLWLRRRKA